MSLRNVDKLRAYICDTVGKRTLIGLEVLAVSQLAQFFFLMYLAIVLS